MKNVCIVGYGAIGPMHAMCLEKISGARLYAVCDTDPEAIARCKAQYDVVCYSDFDRMLEDERIDAVHICTPHYLHFPMIRAALARGKQVVTEKPITRTRAEFEQLLALDGAENICAIVQNRCNRSVVKLKELIEVGELGEILGIKGLMTWKKDPQYYIGTPWKGKWATEGGSCLINQALHTLDLMIYLGGPVESFQASLHNRCFQGIIETEDTVEACLQFANGIGGLFYASNCYVTDTPAEIEVVGTKAIARYAYKKLFLDGKVVAEDGNALTDKDYWGYGHYTLLRDFYEKGRFFSPGDIRDTMDTLFGIYESAGQNGVAYPY